MGHDAAEGVGGDYNVAIGYEAMKASATGTGNCAVGTQAGFSITTATQNTCIGHNAGINVSTGGENTLVGGIAGQHLTTGALNVAIGRGALNKSTTGNFGVAIGAYSQRYNNHSGNHHNVSIGYEAMRGASDASPLTGNANVAGGGHSMEDAQSCYDNTCLGYYAGRNLTTGNSNILIGHNCQPSGGNVVAEITLATGTTGNGGGTFYVESGNGAYNGQNKTAWDQTSDQRIKKNITNYDTGLDIITKLQVRNFEYKTEDEIKTDNPELEDVLKSCENIFKYNSGVQTGLIAQEAELVLPSTVHAPSTGIKAIQTDDIFWHMLNSIKELKKENDDLKTLIKNSSSFANLKSSL